MKNTTINIKEFISYFDLISDSYNYNKESNTLFIIGNKESVETTLSYINKLYDIFNIDALRNNKIMIKSIKMDDDGFDINFGLEQESLELDNEFYALVDRIITTLHVRNVEVIETILNDIFRNIYEQIRPEIRFVDLDENDVESKQILLSIMGYDIGQQILDANQTTTLFYVKSNTTWVSFSDLIGINDINDKTLTIFMSKLFNNR